MSPITGDSKNRVTDVVRKNVLVIALTLLLTMSVVLGGLLLSLTAVQASLRPVLLPGVTTVSAPDGVVSVTYPSGVKSDMEKLQAVYSLEEQMRLEYNRVGENASKDWNKNLGNWNRYRQIFNKKFDQLLFERINLREKILKDNGIDLSKVELNNRIAVMKELWGDRYALKELPTLATSLLLEQIKAIDFDKLDGLTEVDPLEDWTPSGGWAETDPNSKLTVSANEIAFAAVARGDGCYVEKDFGAGHFGSFIHKIDFNITAYTDSYDSQITVYDLFNDDTHWIDIFIQYATTTTYCPQLISMDPDLVSDYGYANKGTRYYSLLERNVTNITLKYYTGSDYETGLVDTLAVSKGDSTTLRYIWNASASSGSGGSITGSLYNLDLQEGPANPITSSPTSNTGSAWTNPTRAYDDGGTGYSNITSGTPSDSNVWGTYGFDLGSSNITQVRVRYDAYSAGYSTGATTQDRVPTADGVTSGTFNQTQVRFATANGASSGTWNPSSGSNYQCVDDQTNPYNNGGDSDYMTGQTNASYQTFTFTAFNIPSTATITNVQVIYRARENSTGTTSSGGRLQIAGTGYNSGTNNPGTTFTTYAATWATNPASAGAWTYQQVNGTDATYPLQQFGIYGTTLATYYQRISICMIICNYTNNSYFYQTIDETTYDDTDYFIHTATDSGYKLFTFTTPDLPTGCTIQNVTIYYRAADGWNAATGTNNVRSCLRIEGTNYSATDVGSNPGGTFTTYSYSYTVNPASTVVWTEADLEGTGSYDLQQFGHFSSDVAPDVQVSMCYMRINYTPASEYDDQIRVDVSWDGGSSWSSTQNTAMTSSEATTWYDVTSVTSWTPTKLNDSNLKVRALAYTQGTGAEEVRLDWLPVEVTWESGAEPDISNTPSSKVFGIVAASTAYYAKGAPPNNPVQDGDCTFNITNSSGFAVDLAMNCTDATGGIGWNLVSTSPSTDEFRITAYYVGQNPAAGLVLTNSDQSFYSSLANSATLLWDFKLDTGDDYADSGYFHDGEIKTWYIYITASAS